MAALEASLAAVQSGDSDDAPADAPEPKPKPAKPSKRASSGHQRRHGPQAKSQADGAKPNR